MGHPIKRVLLTIFNDLSFKIVVGTLFWGSKTWLLTSLYVQNIQNSGRDHILWVRNTKKNAFSGGTQNYRIFHIPEALSKKYSLRAMKNGSGAEKNLLSALFGKIRFWAKNTCFPA